MATQSRVLGSIADERNGGAVTLRVTYDDVQLRLSLVEIANGSTQAVAATAQRAAGGGQTYRLTAPAGQTVQQAIPGSAQNRLGISLDAQGRLDNVDYQFGYV